MRKTRARRRMMAEINVVPYIDVMLVLLVIFMVTAPLITQGVKVELPEADAEPVIDETQSSLPVVITVDQFGDLYLNVGDDKEEPVDPETLIVKLQAVIKYNPKVPVMVRGDANVDYGRVVRAMVLAQAAGVPSVGLVTVPPERGGP
jgi:biopolymer transport protein TolR